ncbi:MAG: RagB/SusD family nutrient uptake outer membrane protein, partial [Muribaculaceae bacterium]|nr:RagB/SusD family nutrient uptake outer membrane protein [Muribaculaceae bacterium]
MLWVFALLCAVMPAMAQPVNQPAACEDAENTAPMMRAGHPFTIPMPLRVGDVNCDGAVDISDATMLINLLLNGGSSADFRNTDVNQDETTDITDATTLINMLLYGTNTNYTADQALEALNDIYKSMRTPGWSTTGNTHQSFGITAYNLMAEVMGDDMIMAAQGSGWFWFDATYNVKSRYVYTSWRSYDLWNAYYTWIADANYILTAAQSMSGTDLEKRYIKGQAYAIRAYSYFMLAQSFARTYKHHENEPCVPLFTGTTFTGSTGQPRSTVAQVYAQIDSDIQQAVNLLNGTTQQDPSHIGYAVAQGLRSRIFLVEEKWNNAYIAARDAITAVEAEGKGIQELS